jgi:hypothetical protein
MRRMLMMVMSTSGMARGRTVFGFMGHPGLIVIILCTTTYQHHDSNQEGQKLAYGFHGL